MKWLSWFHWKNAALQPVLPGTVYCPLVLFYQRLTYFRCWNSYNCRCSQHHILVWEKKQQLILFKIGQVMFKYMISHLILLLHFLHLQHFYSMGFLFLIFFCWLFANISPVHKCFWLYLYCIYRSFSKN